MFYGVINESTYIDPFEIELENFDNFCKSLNIVQESGIVLQEGAWETIKEKIIKAWKVFVKWVKELIENIKKLFKKRGFYAQSADRINRAIQRTKETYIEPFEVVYYESNNDARIINDGYKKIKEFDQTSRKISNDEDMEKFRREVDNIITGLEIDVHENFRKTLYTEKRATIKSVKEAKELSKNMTTIIGKWDDCITKYTKIIDELGSIVFKYEKDIEKIENDKTININGSDISADVIAEYIKSLIEFNKTALNGYKVALNISDKLIAHDWNVIDKIRKDVNAKDPYDY